MKEPVKEPLSGKWVRTLCAHRQHVVLAILLMVAMVLWTVRLVSTGTPLSTNAASPPDAVVDHVPESTKTAASSPVTWPDELHRDVFAWDHIIESPEEPAVDDQDTVRTKALTALHLEAIIVIGNVRHAMVNGRMLRSGQSIDGFRIDQINSRHIVVSKHNVEVVIDL